MFLCVKYYEISRIHSRRNLSESAPRNFAQFSETGKKSSIVVFRVTGETYFRGQAKLTVEHFWDLGRLHYMRE